MYKMYRILIAIVLACTSVVFILAGCTGLTLRDSKEDVFSRDYKSLSLVADYLVSLEYNSVYITSDDLDGEMYTSGKTCFIDNEDVVKAIALLREAGYSVIDKGDGVVTFVYWSTKDAGKGFAYSSDGSKPQLEFQTYLEELSTENWFYYEEDFNLWKLRSQGKA